MYELVTKTVDFNGSQLMAAQDSDGVIYVGVNWVADGIGLDKAQRDYQVLKVQTNPVLSRGAKKFSAGVFDANNETVAIEIDFLPLWLTKITVTPKMQKTQPEVAERLIEYQLKAKDVLASAFIQPVAQSSNNAKELGYGETASLIKVLESAMRRNGTPQHVIMKQAHMLLEKVGIPALPEHVFAAKPAYEQLLLPAPSQNVITGGAA